MFKSVGLRVIGFIPNRKHQNVDCDHMMLACHSASQGAKDGQRTGLRNGSRGPPRTLGTVVAPWLQGTRMLQCGDVRVWWLVR